MAAPTAKVRTGTLVGRRHEGYLEFLGVPYARAPLGPAAFLPPQGLPDGNDVWQCDRYGATANQYSTPSAFVPEPIIAGDNPLNLNVWTPSLGDARLPVFVWIHGGGFVGGCNASPWYHGGHFAHHGVVAVAVNYRLGPEGFLRIGDDNANRGLRDIITALGWIQDNIAALGGDPDRVTIGGQSSGGASALALFTSGAAGGLFRRTAVQSSGGMLAARPEKARAMSEHFAAAVGVALDPEQLARVSPGLRLTVDPNYHPGHRPAWNDADTDADTNAAAADSSSGSGSGADGNADTDTDTDAGLTREGLTWRPTVDGTVIEADIYTRARAGATNGEALLIGTTAEELVGPVAAGAAEMTGIEIVAALRSLGLDEAAVARYLELGAARTSQAWALGQAFTDWRYRIPARVMSELASKAMAVFKYEFRFAARSPEPGAHRAQHSSDLPFVFDNLDAERVSTSVGRDAPQPLAEEMHGAWVRFVEGNQEPWPSFQPSAPHTMVFEAGSRLLDLGPALAELWGDSPGSTAAP